MDFLVGGFLGGLGMGTAGEISEVGAEVTVRGMEAVNAKGLGEGLREGLMLVLIRGCREKVTGVDEVVGDDEHREVVDIVVVGCVKDGISCMRGAVGGRGTLVGGW